MTNNSSRADRAVLFVALAVALTLATSLYVRHLPQHRELWSDALHDRNAHYFYGLSLALDVRNLDPVSFVHDANSAKVWPPLHGFLLGGILTFGGFDTRLAVLPSLCAWAGLLVAVFVLARRLSPSAGNVAGCAALLFTLASPAHRAFATDVMLESLGVCLTLWALERYVAVRQSPGPVTGRTLGLVLTALFLTKFNYWVLVVAGFVSTEFITRPAAVLRFAATVWRVVRPRLLDPLLVLALLALVGAGILTRVAPLRIGPVRIQHGGELATLAVALVLIHAVLWRYRGAGRRIWPTVPAELRTLLAWGVLPVVVWFALPGRVAAFLWYGFAAGEAPDFSISSRATKLAGWLFSEYHPDLVVFGSVVAGVLLAALAVRSLRPGAAAVLIFLAISALLTLQHVNSKARFLMNWTPALWVLAGVGISQLARVHRAVSGVALAAVLAVCLPAGLTVGHAEEGGPHLGTPSLLPLAEAFLPHVRNAERTAILANVPMKFFTQWSYLQETRARRDRAIDGRGWLHLENPDLAAFSAWLDRTRCDRVVLLEISEDSPFRSVPPGWTGDRVLSQWQATQQFEQTERWPVSELGATVVVYRRATLAGR